LRAFPLAKEYDAIHAEIDDEMLRAPMPQRDRRLIAAAVQQDGVGLGRNNGYKSPPLGNKEAS
jgi:hypothetical protein